MNLNDILFIALGFFAFFALMYAIYSAEKSFKDGYKAGMRDAQRILISTLEGKK